MQVIVYDWFYCQDLNMFSYEPHLDKGVGCRWCCELCIFQIDQKDFHERQWLPRAGSGEVVYTVDGEVWRTWYQVPDLSKLFG